MWIQKWATCNKQPRGPFRISQSSPIAQGLVFAAVGGKPVNLVNGRPGTIVGTVGTNIEDNKRIFKTATGAANRIDFPSCVPATHRELTFGSVFYHTGPGTFQYLILRDISNPPVHLIGIAAAGQLQHSFGSGGVILSTPTVPANVWHVCSSSTPPASDIEWFQSAGRMYLNAVKQDTGGGNNALAYTSPASTAITLNGRSLDNARQLAGAQALSVVWDRTLTNAHHASFGANPWQVFEELVSQTWVGFTVAGASSFSVSISESFTSSATQTSFISAALAATETASATESPSSIASSAAAASESATSTDSPSGSAASSVAGAETATATESPSSTAASPVAISESTSATESPSSTASSTAAASEAATATESSSTAASSAAAIAESITITDTLGAVSNITRPSSDITTTGWTATPGPDFFDMLNEAAPDDADYITSPDLTAGSSTITLGLTQSLAAGTYTINFRSEKSSTVDRSVRVFLLNDANAVQGTSGWTVVTAAYATYAVPISTTGLATRVRIEAQ